MTALAAASLISPALAPQASAAQRNTVIVGDSLPANPALADTVFSKIRPNNPQLASSLAPNGRINALGCGTDFYFSDTYSHISGRPAANYTCPGASFRTGGVRIAYEIEEAARHGDLTPATDEVIIFAGANDFWPRMLHGEALPGVEAPLHGVIVDTIREAQRLAPHARIKVVGVPAVANHEGGVCVLNVIPHLPMGIPAEVVADAESALQRTQADASRQTGATFVDTRAMTAEHSTCSDDRWIGGIIDTTAGSRQNLLLHMTESALTRLAEATARS